MDAGNILDNARYPIVVLRGHFDKPIPENRKIYFYICHIGMELHQNGIKLGSLGTPQDLPPGTRTAGNGWLNLTSPGISTTDEIIILSCRSRSDMPGLYDYLLNEIHVGRAPALSEIRPHRRRAGHAGGRHRPAGRRAWRHLGAPPPDGGSPSYCPKFSPTSCTIA
ncbi:MAG: hypothetical protein ACLRWP_13290 [Bilophila wadsworthia]